MRPVSLIWISQKPRSSDRSGWAAMAKTANTPASASGRQYNRLPRNIGSFSIVTISRPPLFPFIVRYAQAAVKSGIEINACCPLRSEKDPLGLRYLRMAKEYDTMEW